MILFLCLDMSFDQSIDETHLQPADTTTAAKFLSDDHNVDNPETVSEEGVEQPPGLGPLSNLSSSSGNTEESLSAFADQILRKLSVLDPSLDITFLSAPDQTSQQVGVQLAPGKVSESEALNPTRR